jgi:Endonuclease/Exonuclease/phosphatase family
MPVRRTNTVLLLLIAISTAGCLADDRRDVTSAVSIMTFNVENLFDNVDDPGKDDRTYLPLAAKQTAEHRAACALIEVDRWREQCLDWDWNDALVERKLATVAAAILQVNDGRGADIVALQEVENMRILERLRTDYLQAADYLPPVLIEGADLRGIDVAFLSRLPLAGTPKLHPIRFDDRFADRVGDTRGILQADFALPDGTTLTGFAVHFPAPFHPTGMRISAYDTLNELLAALPADRPAFGAGDFNTTSTEDAAEKLLDRFARPHWTVAHDLGCGDDCRGSAYYARDDSWSFLDMLLWSPARRGADATWSIRANSVRVANAAPGQRREDGTPARFDPSGGAGVSDHWPVVMTIESN